VQLSNFVEYLVWCILFSLCRFVQRQSGGKWCGKKALRASGRIESSFGLSVTAQRRCGCRRGPERYRSSLENIPKELVSRKIYRKTGAFAKGYGGKGGSSNIIFSKQIRINRKKNLHTTTKFLMQKCYNIIIKIIKMIIINKACYNTIFIYLFFFFMTKKPIFKQSLQFKNAY